VQPHQWPKTDNLSTTRNKDISIKCRDPNQISKSGFMPRNRVAMQKLSVVDIQFDHRNSDLNEIRAPLTGVNKLSPIRK